MKDIKERYQVVVIGAGHAGCEAALASARMGCKTLLATLNMDTIALMPCNPSIGGPGKSHLVYEIDALGGEMGRNIEKSYIHKRTLNMSKGPAVRAVRAQADKKLYQREMKKTILSQENLDIIQAEITEIITEDSKVTGIRTFTGIVYGAEKVIVTAGTYLKSNIVIGPERFEGGPHNQMPADFLSESFIKNGVKLDRYQTATPPRIKRSSVVFDDFRVIEGEIPEPGISFFERRDIENQFNTYVVKTNTKTIDEIKNGLVNSPLTIKNITDKGPRYCPSIDRKVMNFPEKMEHQIFIEPEGFNTQELYLQGLTSATPEETQVKILRTIHGLENVEIMRPGYGIEYDYVLPDEFKETLELKKINGVYTAGQINGTSGYEEAAAQGLIAGINAALRIQNREEYIPAREDSYIGVLINDLVSKEHYEPYRIFTSSAEYRLLLRQDNAVLRLSPIGYLIGLLSRKDFEKVRKYRWNIHKEKNRLKNFYIKPGLEINNILSELKEGSLKNKISGYEILKRPNVNYKDLKKMGFDENNDINEDIINNLNIEIKYEGYIERQIREVKRIKKMNKTKIPENFDYKKIKGISREAMENLLYFNPNSFYEIKKLPGISSHELNIIYIFLKRYKSR